MFNRIIVAESFFATPIGLEIMHPDLKVEATKGLLAVRMLTKIFTESPNFLSAAC